jgi:hypothetical protein
VAATFPTSPGPFGRLISTHILAFWARTEKRSMPELGNESPSSNTEAGSKPAGALRFSPVSPGFAV